MHLLTVLPSPPSLLAGPPAAGAQVLAMFHHVRRQWPGARVVGSTLEDYLEGLMGALAQGGLTLPVVTGA